MKTCDLKELRPNKIRVLIEHGLTLVIWSFWLTSLIVTLVNWHSVAHLWASYSALAKLEMFYAAVIFVSLCIRWKFGLGSKQIKFGAPKLDPAAKSKCLAMFGWSEEDLSIAQTARSFDVHGPGDSLTSIIRVQRLGAAQAPETQEAAIQHG